MTTTTPTTTAVDRNGEQPLDIEALFPADPDLMISPERDTHGLKELQDQARDRRSELAHR